MEPTRDTHYTLVDLLDRVLDKGVVLYADIIVSVAGIPLIGVNLRAALAGMETMLSYGVMQEWDEKVRAQSSQQWEKALKEIIAQQGVVTNEEDMDTCSRCGKEAPVGELLERGCDRCGWVSPRLKKQAPEIASG